MGADAPIKGPPRSPGSLPPEGELSAAWGGPAPLTVQFASDNNAGICPEAFAALREANRGHVFAYGADPWTERACAAIRRTFDCDADVYLVFSGTAANALALSAMCRPSDAVICHAFSHVNVDECGATERFSGGAKLLGVDTPLNKLTPDAVAARIVTPHDVHSSRPRALSLTQATELGTVYTVDELRALCATAHARGVKVHMDGARFANAVVSLDCHPADITQRAGVDVLSFGGTKNGMPFGEAVVFFDRSLAEEFGRRRMQGGQLASKMRFLAAPWIAMLESGAWLERASHANAMARRLAEGLTQVAGGNLLAPVDANGVFIDLPRGIIDGLHARGWQFYVFVGDTGCRFMCAWDTTLEAIDALLRDIRELEAANGAR
ncbi:MAG TPA: low specificity L-threonine aldolase [Casimicrobiaceae bacterium]|nr:low specificity L-threonine aldolase [Casimicrobiaceae bacterium]